MKTEKNILAAFILNLLFSVFEFIGGSVRASPSPPSLNITRKEQKQA